MTALRIGKDQGGRAFTLPESIVTATMAILSKKGAGKTYLAGVIEEEMARQHLPFVVLDPVGVHYGLRSSADGASPGYPVVVFGGEHGDVPLDRRMGADLARTIINDNISAIIDLSDQPSKTAWREVVRDFCIAMFKLNRTPRHVFIEEATEFVPQTRRPEMQEAYEAVERMCRLGRNRGLGVSIIAQRSAQVAKDVLSQIDILIALRHTGKHDRDAIIDALKDDLSDEQLRDDLPVFRNSVTSLDDGEAWVWWPKNGVFSRIRVRERTTYHAGATPTFGAQAQPVMATPDITKLREQFKAVVEQREADDPKKLRARIAELERELKKEKPAADCGHADEIAALRRTGEQQAALIARASAGLEEAVGGVHALLAAMPTLQQIFDEVRGYKPTPVPERRTAPARGEPVAGRNRREPQQRPPAISSAPSNGHSAVSTPQKRILDALASFEVLGRPILEKRVLAILSGQSPKSSGYFNNLGRLRNQLGLIDYPRDGTVTLTDEGRKHADAEAAPRTLDEYQERWLGLFSAPQQAILRVLIARWPDAIDKPTLADETNQSIKSSGYMNNLGYLRGFGVLDYPEPGWVIATELLFPGGLA